MGVIEKDVPLAPFTTFKIGGKARYFTRVKSVEELEEARRFWLAKSGATPILILGGGSNLLISDEGFAGLVIKMEIGGVEWKKEGGMPAGKAGGARTMVRAGAGENWDSLVAESVKRKLW